jgi:Kef-type K+ transport system membrane component KefB
MDDVSLTFSFFLIFCGAAVFASVALYTRQPLIIAYIVLGMIIGPYGISLISDLRLLADTSQIGIIFLLFLLGLDMQPQALITVVRKATLIALVSSVIFAASGYCVALLFGFSQIESLIIGAAMMFSSTIIGIKLLPTTVLHHKHTGELMVGLLLLQDLIAIFVLLILMQGQDGSLNTSSLLQTAGALPLLVGLSLLFVRYILLKLISRFDHFHEYIFLLAIGWCLGMAEFAKFIGLSEEIGAFIAGVSIATSPIAQYIATNLKPLRDFFLIMFFFSLGARFDLGVINDIAIPAITLALLMLALKPVCFRFLLSRLSESKGLAWDVGFRLGQISEFSLLIAYIATSSQLIGKEASHLIQATAIITFVISSYIVIFNYPNPIAISDKLRRD